MEQTALIIQPSQGSCEDVALQTALALWAEVTTRPTSGRRDELQHDKRMAVQTFFAFIQRAPHQVTPVEVNRWREQMEAQGLKPATVYARLSRLSSFYEWARRDAQIGQQIISNPVKLARPKAPRAYQTESVSALTDAQLQALVEVVKNAAATGSLAAKRDYAILLFFLLSGMRRSEVIGLRGGQVREREGVLLVRSVVKGGDYVERELDDPLLREALHNYLTAAKRMETLKVNAPLWTRHDRAGKPGAMLSSHAFAHNLKQYARQAGIEHIHIHQTRHTFARIVAEESGSMTETQDALGHRNLATTRVYVQRVAVKRDKFSRKVANRIKLRS